MSIQVIIIVIYFALTVAIGLYTLKKSKTSDSFHGAQLGVAAIVCASAGEWLGGTATTGVSEYGFNDGMSGSWYTIANGIGVMFLALCFAKLYRSLETVTVPGIIEHFYGVKARSVSSVVLTIVMLAVGLSQMIAAGKLGQNLLGIEFNIAVLGFAVIFIIYTLAGGMNAVASTNVLHLFVMYGGVIIAVIAVLMLAGGPAHVSDSLAAIAAEEGKASFFNMGRIGMPKVSSWIIASLLGACTAQAGVQPVLAAKDVPTAKFACILTAIVAAPFGLFTAYLGMCARVMSNEGILFKGGVQGAENVVDAKSALPALMMNLHPVVGGLVLAAILAAILSTISPIILAAGTMVTKDLYQRVFKPSAPDKEILLFSRVATGIAGVICSLAAIAFVNLTAVLDIVYSAYSLRGALFIVVLFGIYWKGASEKGACWAMVLTAIVAVGWVAVKLASGGYPLGPVITETYAAVVAAAVATIVFSLIFPKKKDGIQKAS
ncbi:MAG: sodium:solute symporter family protein [Clostridiales Family XIII bacterium]|jgi:SSS family solute:Na+ symporter|nr:sodium:solute symporter family protein [Clostridiales Family XIII bacterium]